MVVTASTVLGLSGAAMAMLVVWVVCFVGGHVVNRDMTPFVHAVSEYGAWQKSRPFIMGCWWTIACVSILDSACVGVLLNDIPGGIDGYGAVAIVFLVIFAAARVLTSAFKTDVVDRPGYVLNRDHDTHSREEQPSARPTGDDGRPERSTEGRLHGLFALISFVSILVVAIEIPRAFNVAVLNGTELSNNYGVLYGFMWAVIVTLIVMVVSLRIIRLYFGLTERLFYAAHIGFLFTLTVTLIQQGRQMQSND